MTDKRCSKCHIVKDHSCFSRKTTCLDGLQYQCKDCCKSNGCKYVEENAEKIRKKKHLYYLRNKKHINSKNDEYRKANKEKCKITRDSYVAKNVHVRIKIAMRNRLSAALRAKQSCKKIHISECGCSPVELIAHLQRYLFVMGMTMEMRGNYGWHLDHIIPFTEFDLTTKDGQLAANHYTNLMPLWWEDNISKRENPKYWDTHQITIFKPVVFGDHFIGFDEFDSLEY